MSLDILWTAVDFWYFLSPPFYGLVNPASASVPALYSIHDLLTKHTPTVSVFHLDHLAQTPDQTPITQSKQCEPVSATAAIPPLSSVTIVPSISTSHSEPTSNTPPIIIQANKSPPSALTSSPPSQNQLADSSAQSPEHSTSTSTDSAASANESIDDDVSHSEPTSNTPPIIIQANESFPSAPTSSPPSQNQSADSSDQSPEHSTSTSTDSASSNGSINDDVPGAPPRKRGVCGRKRDSTTALGEPNSKPAKRQKRYVHLHNFISSTHL
jgi:hypothetical protein